MVEQRAKRLAGRMQAIAQPGVNKRVAGSDVLRKPLSIEREDLTAAAGPGTDGLSEPIELQFPGLALLSEPVGSQEVSVAVAGHHAWTRSTPLRRRSGETTHLDAGTSAEATMAKTHTTLDLDRELLAQAAEALGTTRTTETVHAALREVVARRKRAWLARRDFSELEKLLPEIRAPRSTSAS